MKLALVLVALPGWIAFATVMLVWLAFVAAFASLGVGFVLARILRNQSLLVLVAVSLPTLALILLKLPEVRQIETFGELLATMTIVHFVAVVGTAALRMYFRREQV